MPQLPPASAASCSRRARGAVSLRFTHANTAPQVPARSACSTVQRANLACCCQANESERIEAFVERGVLAAIAQAVRIGAREFFVSGSMGIALYPCDGAEPTEILRLARAGLAAEHLEIGLTESLLMRCTTLPRRSNSSRRASRDRRLRHWLFAQLPRALSHRPAQDRSIVRRRSHARTTPPRNYSSCASGVAIYTKAISPRARSPRAFAAHLREHEHVKQTA